MKKSDMAYILGSVFAAATGVFYCITSLFHIPLLRYYPTLHTWQWGKQKGIPSQGWYGKQVFAYVAAAFVTLVVYIVLNRKYRGCEEPAELPPKTAKLTGVAALLVVLASMVYILHHEFAKWGVYS